MTGAKANTLKFKMRLGEYVQRQSKLNTKTLYRTSIDPLGENIHSGDEMEWKWPPYVPIALDN